MSTGHRTPDHIRVAAIADYRTGTDSLQIVADRHQVSKAALAAWINPERPKTRPRNRTWTEEEIAYIGGDDGWYVRGGVRYPLFPEPRSA